MGLAATRSPGRTVQAPKDSEAETLGTGLRFGLRFGLAEDTVALFHGGTDGDETLGSQEKAFDISSEISRVTTPQSPMRGRASFPPTAVHIMPLGITYQ